MEVSGQLQALAVLPPEKETSVFIGQKAGPRAGCRFKMKNEGK
jgi:hypothetical protein